MNTFFGVEADSVDNGTLKLSCRPTDENFMVDGIEFAESLIQPAITFPASLRCQKHPHGREAPDH